MSYFTDFKPLFSNNMLFAPKIILFVVPVQIEEVFHVKWFTSRRTRSEKDRLLFVLIYNIVSTWSLAIWGSA